MSDQKLLQLVTGAAPAAIADVIDLMEQIDANLASGDGLKWFNFLYLAVTNQVRDFPPASGWADESWLTRLDVNFAGFYFAAIEEFLKADSRIPSSWTALFEARHKPGIDRIQFALAGMNAHINHDLSLALIQTNQQFGIKPGLASPEHDDFERVNSLLEFAIVAQDQITGALGRSLLTMI